MSEESKIADPELNRDVAAENVAPAAQDDNDGPEEEGEGASKKKKSKKAKLKKALGRDGDTSEAGSSSNPSSKLTDGMLEQLMEMNPSLRSEVANMDKSEAAEKLKSLDVASLMTGLVYYVLKAYNTSTDPLSVCEREESKRYGVVQVLANSACASLRSVSCPGGASVMLSMVR